MPTDLVATIDVDVALTRPPRVDATVRVVVSVPVPDPTDPRVAWLAEADAITAATQVAAATPMPDGARPVMPVGHRVITITP